MSRLGWLCCRPRAPPAARPAAAPPATPPAAPAMGAALSRDLAPHDTPGPPDPPHATTMADVIRERKKKSGGGGLGTLRRRLAAAARRGAGARGERGCEHARHLRAVVASWRVVDVWLLLEQLEAGAALRDLAVQAELARAPAAALPADLAAALRGGVCADVELAAGAAAGAGAWALPAHRAVLAARSAYFRDLLRRHPSDGPWATRVPLEGRGAALTRGELAAALRALYAPAPPGHAPSGRAPARTACRRCAQAPTPAPAPGDAERECGDSEASLDIVNGDNSSTCRSWCGCGHEEGAGGGVGGGGATRLSELLGYSLDPHSLHADMRYLLDSGEYADCRLSWGGEGRSSGDIPCHRVVLAARSRFFRNVLSRRAGAGAGAGGGGLVCVDEKVLPRRFARALLHAAYTDQVDLTLIGRPPSTPAAGVSNGGGGTAWAGVVRGGSRSTMALLEDAFQLYEIARFLEMPILAQGCEDAIAECLSAETVGAAARWAAAPAGSDWVRRAALRLVRDEFAAVALQADARLPHATLAAALASPFLQASEAQALRAVLRRAEREPEPERRERAEPGELGGRDSLAQLAALVRVEHLAPDCDVLQQAVRRGLVAPPAAGGAGGAGGASGASAASGGAWGSARAWLGRGASRPARCLLAHLDELRALLRAHGHAPPAAELARARRDRRADRIPDTLYMVAAERGEAGGAGGAGAGAGEAACVSPRTAAALRARVRELRAAPAAARALALPAARARDVYTQLALRAVREMSLPDSCAELLLTDIDQYEDDRERGGSGSVEWQPSPRSERASRWPADDCCQSGSARCSSNGSLRSLHDAELGRSGSCRRELSARADVTHHRQSPGEWPRGGAGGGVGGGGGGGGIVGGGGGARLSAAVPDVAMAPNGNTHLLTARDYYRHAHHAHHAIEYGSALCGGAATGVLQLDLGDGATHAPRPGSRAHRAATQGARAGAGAGAGPAGGPAARARRDDELRAAIELSVIRAYSSFRPRAGSPSGAASGAISGALSGAIGGARRGTLPAYRHDVPAILDDTLRRGGSPGPPPSAPPAPAAHLHSLSRAGSAERAGTAPGAVLGAAPGAVLGAAPGAGGRALRTPSPRRPRHDYSLYRHDYRSEGGYSRGHSPNGYA